MKIYFEKGDTVSDAIAVARTLERRGFVIEEMSLYGAGSGSITAKRPGPAQVAEPQTVDVSQPLI